ncbi:MAG: AAA family ATPase [Candidatus Eisenbacteria bacterium]|nr:AAA family ATPase [Candidatus Eisenbacteria bacterium]
MYTAFYQLNERPFELTPDLRFLYLSPKHREALAHLSYGVAERKVFVQLTGEVGTGKTLMLDALVHGLDATTRVARITNTTISKMDLLRALAWELGLSGDARTKMEMLREISECLARWSADGRNAVFVIDEAQNLEPPVLEEIRLLSNLRSLDRSTLQIVLAGQPELRAKLEDPELRQLRQRIGIRYHLEPLSQDETGEYIRHRLGVAGAKDDRIFDASAIEAVYEFSQGIPRMINIICDNSLLAGYADGKRWIGRRTVRETVEALETREPARTSGGDPDAART